ERFVSRAETILEFEPSGHGFQPKTSGPGVKDRIVNADAGPCRIAGIESLPDDGGSRGSPRATARRDMRFTGRLIAKTAFPHVEFERAHHGKMCGRRRALRAATQVDVLQRHAFRPQFE